MRNRPTVAILAAACGVLAACVEPAIDEDGPSAIEDLPEIAEAPAEGFEELREELAALRDRFAHVDGALAEALAANDVEAATAAGEAAALALADDGEAPNDAPPVFPLRTLERTAESMRPPLLFTALGAAQSAGGTMGREAGAVIAEVIAGDLGAWQRDAEGMVAMAADAGTIDGPMDERERAVLELPGDGTRALAWALALSDAPDLDAAHALAERARAHVGLVLQALDELNDAPEPAATP